jgi:hypothetical protein
MLVVFFDIEGTVNHRYFAVGQMVNQCLYKYILEHLAGKVCHKRLAVLPHQWVLNYVNACSYLLLSVTIFGPRAHDNGTPTQLLSSIFM